MKGLTQETEIKLLEYIDGTLSAGEASELMRTVEQDPALKERLRELQELSASLGRDPLPQPSKNFTQRVMSRLDQYPRTVGAPLWKNVVLLAGIIVTAGIATWLVSIGIFDNTTQIDLNTIVFQNDSIGQSLPSIRFDGKMIVNSIIVFNLVIAFFLLDRTVFRPWFHRRSRLHF